MVNGAMLLATRGETGAARERLAEARTLMARGCTPVYETWYWAGLALTAETEEQPEQALAAYESMSATAQRFNNAGVAITLRPGQVLALVDCGRTAEAVGLAREVVETLEQPDAPSGLAHALGALAVALTARGEVTEALATAGRAAALGEELEGARPRALALATAGAALQRLGTGAPATGVLRRALEGFESMGWRPRAEQIRRLLAECEPNGTADGAAAPERPASALRIAHMARVASAAG